VYGTRCRVGRRERERAMRDFFVRKWISILLVLCSIMLVSCQKKRNEIPVEKAIPVEVAPVRQGIIAKEIKFTGSIEANTEVQVYPKITATIEEMKVDSGDSIKKGDVIALLESEELEAQAAQAEAALEVVKAQWTQMEIGARPEERAQAEDLVAKARANLKDAESNYGRMKALYQQGTIARRQFEAAELAYTVAKAELNSAIERRGMLREGATREEREALTAQVSQVSAALDLARIRLSYATIGSPIDGTVSERFVDPGNLAVPTKPLVTIVQMDTVMAIVYFPEDQIRYMEPGIGAQLTVAAYPDEVFFGRIDKVSPTLNPDTRMFSADIKVPNKEGLLRPGMFARVTLSVDPHSDALLVPKEAVLSKEEYRENSGSGKGGVARNTYLFVVENGRARIRTVLLGHEAGTAVEVAEGLKQGEQIVTRGVHQLKDGDRVTVIEPKESGA
jgi:RND family efflux transporter MFP subunit